MLRLLLTHMILTRGRIILSRGVEDGRYIKGTLVLPLGSCISPILESTALPKTLPHRLAVKVHV